LRQVVHEEPRNHAAWLLLAEATPDKKLAAQYINRASLLKAAGPPAKVRPETGPAESGSSRRILSWRVAALVAAVALLLGMAAASLNGRAWLQAVALQPTETDGRAAAPLGSTQSGTERFSPAAEDAGEAALARPTAVPAPHSAGLAQSPAAPAAGMLPEVDSAAGQDTSFEPVVITDPDKALPAAILKGIETQSSSSENQAPATSAEVSSAAAYAGVTEAETAAEAGAASAETANVAAEAADEAAVDGVAASEAEAQELAAAEEEVAVSEGGDLYTAAAAPGERWIDVDLTTQTLVAYEGDAAVLTSLISSGMWQFPTVTGQYHTWIKYESQDMSGLHLGYNYYLEDVPYVMYFFEDYAIHGAYWHNNFGTPMSHGCVNMNTADAGWLYNWAPLGTLVNIHY
jgi:lipoprotein-anchoring transpeptidase ErfK/SrfK